MNADSQALHGPLRELTRARRHWRWRAVYHHRNDSAAFTALLTDPDASLARASVVYKDDPVATVWGLNLEGRRLVIKRYNRRGFWDSLRRYHRASRASAAWRHAWELIGCELPTPTPLAFIEESNWGLAGRCYLITEALVGPHARKYFADCQDPEQIASAARRVARVIRGLWAAGFVHGDLKDTNLILTPEGPFLIDLDGVQEYPPGSQRRERQRRERQRFLRNWQGQPELRALFEGLLPDQSHSNVES